MIRHLVACVLSAGVALATYAEPWTFVSTPDFLNIDVGDLTTYSGPQFNSPSGTSTSASYEAAIGTFLDGIASESPDFVMVAGDLVMARWQQDAWTDGVFGPKFADKAARDANTTLAIEQQRVMNAANFYYPIWKQRFADRNLPVYAAVGDHELGDDFSWSDLYGKQTIETHRDLFADYFVNPLVNDLGSNLAAGSSLYTGGGSVRPTSGQHASTAYAIQHKNALILSVDVFRRNANNSLTVTVDGEQLQWLQDTLAAADADPTIDHVLVQGHTPVLQPVATRVSGNLKIVGAENSDFWQTMLSGGVDAYLAGEVHAITVSQNDEDPLVQIAHGGIFGFQAANTISYLKGTVDGDAMTLELKELGFSVSGSQFYQPGNPTTALKDTITLNNGGEIYSVGSVTIDKSLGYTRYLNATGRFSSLVSPTGPAAVTLGNYTFDSTGDSNAFTTDVSAKNVVDGVSLSDFSAHGVTVLTEGLQNLQKFATEGWPGASGSLGPSSFDVEQYVSFTASATEAGTLLDLDALRLSWNRTNKGPDDGILRVSTDGFATWTEFTLFTDGTGSNTDNPIEVLLGSIDPAELFEFRFYFKDSDTTGSTYMRLDDVSLIGNVVPEPATAAVVGLAAAAGFMRPRRR